MPFNGNGVFTLIYTWENDRIAGIPVTASRMDTETVDIANGLTNCITRDGQSPPSTNIPMNSKKFTGLGDGSAATDSVALGQVQRSVYSWGGTAGGTANALTIAVSPLPAALVAGQAFAFIASADNTTTITLDVNMLGAKNVYKLGEVELREGDILTDAVIVVRYDGTNFQVVSGAGFLSTTFAPIGSYAELTNVAGSVSGALIIDYLAGQHYEAILSGNITSITITNWPASPVTAFMDFKFTQAASGGPYTVAQPSLVKWVGGTAPVMSTTASATDEYIWKSSNGLTTAQGYIVGQGWLGL